MDKLMNPEVLMEISKCGEKRFRETVLNGPLMKNILKEIEDAAFNGYTGHKRKVVSSEMRELSVIKDFFNENGYHCEFEVEKKKSILGEYSEQYFVVSWDTKK